MTLNMSRFGETKMIAVLAALCVLVGGAFGFFAWRDLDSVSAIKKETEAEQAAIDVAMRKKASIPGLERDVIVLRENVHQYVKILPDNREINDFVNRINSFADQADVVVMKLDDIDRKNRGRSNKAAKEPFEKVEYKLQISGAVEGLLTFMGLFESYDRFVKIALIELKAGRGDNKGEVSRDSQGRLLHAINLQLETYVYNGGDGSADRAKIRDYETKRDALAADIAKAREVIEIEKYDLKVDKGRRDPFIDPRTHATSSDPKGLAKQKEILDRMIASFEKIESALKTESAEQDLIRRSELRRANDGRLRDFLKDVVAMKSAATITAAPLKEEFQKRILSKIDVIVKERGISGNEAGFTVADLERVRGKLQDLSDKGDFAGVVGSFEDLERTADLGSLPPAAAPVLAEIQKLNNVAKIQVEFTARAISIEGLIYRPEGSAVIINGQVLSAGDALDGDTVVSRIDEGEIEFSYKSVKIIRLVR